MTPNNQIYSYIPAWVEDYHHLVCELDTMKIFIIFTFIAINLVCAKPKADLFSNEDISISISVERDYSRERYFPQYPSYNQPFRAFPFANG